MKGFNSNMAEDYHTSQSNLMATDPQQQIQPNQRAEAQQDLYSSGSGRQSRGIVDEMQQDLTYLSREAPLDGGESTFGVATSHSQLGLAGGAGSQRGESVLHMASSQDQLSSTYNSHLRTANQEDDLLADWQSRQDGAGSPAATSYNYNEQALNQLSPDNVDIQRPLQQAGQFQEHQQSTSADHQRPDGVDAGANDLALSRFKPFLVSFMVDARGGAMRGCRHSGVRVIIPPNSAQMPMRITCRYLRRERLVHPPPLMEGEACASKIMEVGPAGAKFLKPVLIEVPHFASLRGKEREIIILRSDSGEVWREHLFEADQKLVDSIIRSAGDDDHQLAQNDGQLDKENAGGDGGGDKKRLTRIVTNEFPQYFAIISRVRQEVHPVGPDGSTVDSQVVDKVQAIFTEGALTKRIKIGLQKQHEQQPQAPDQAAEQSAELRSGSPANISDHQHQDRAVSPQSGDSATAKRRSRFLACFGAGHGSIEPLNGGDLLMSDATDGDSSAAGGDSPRQPCKEEPVKKRFILGDVNDSDCESIKSSADSPLNRKRRHIAPSAQEHLVPEDYYIEKELPLILNIEPTTYGKRMASSSAQTDSKLNGSNGFIMTTSAKKPKKKRRGLLGRRKHKTQMNICCEPAPTRPKSVEPVVDSSLESTTNEQQQLDLPDSASMIQDVVTSDDHKWRTCIIQTDSDSVTVNYVTLNAADEAAAAVAIAEAKAATSGGDDGYVSGSGDLKKENSFGKGLFHLPFGSSSASGDEPKSSHKKTKEPKEKAKIKKDATSDEEDKVSSTEADEEREQLQSLQNQADESLRSLSPTSKELKLKSKLERQEKQRREKEEKRLQKEAEEATAKAEKLKRKQEKEAKKAEKLAQKASKKSPPQSKPASPAPNEESAAPTCAKSASQVKFAADLVSGDNREPVRQLDSIQNVIDSTNASYEQQKERLSQEDGRDMIEVSIGDKTSSDLLQPGEGVIPASQQQDDPSLVSRTLEVHHSIAKTLLDSKDELERAEEKLISLSSEDDQTQTQSSAELSAEKERAQHQFLRPILKQQSTTEEVSAEITIGDERSLASKLVSEATEEAVRAADKLRSESTEADPAALESRCVSSSASIKEEKERLKREAKEERQRQKEAKKQAKEAEATAKKAAKEAKLEAERQAKEAKAEQDRLAKEAKLEKARLAKEAKADKDRLAKEAKAEKERLAKEAKEASERADAVEAPPVVSEQIKEEQSAELQQVIDSDQVVAEPNDKSAAKESRRRFKIKFPSFGSNKSSSLDRGAKSDESEPTTLADDTYTDDSAAVAAAAAKVVEDAVAEAERLAAGQLVTSTDDAIKEAVGSAKKESVQRDEGAQVDATTESAEDETKKSDKKQRKFKLSFPKFGASSSPTKSETDESKEEKSSGSSDSEAKLEEALEALKKATLEARQEYERLAKEAEDELSAELKETKLKLAQEAKEKAADADKAAQEANMKFKRLGRFKVKLPKFGSSPSSADADPSESVSKDHQDKEESSIAGPKAIDVSIGDPVEVSTSRDQSADTTTEASPSQRKKKKDSAKPKKEKKTKKAPSAGKVEASTSGTQESSESEPNATSKSSGSFFSRLFSKSKKPAGLESSQVTDADDADSEPANVEQSADTAAGKQLLQGEQKPMIVSEMYPSDPDDEDGEMILEVNLPHNLIQEAHHRKESSHANDASQMSDTLATTIDETLATSTVPQSSKPSKEPASMSSPSISIEQHREKGDSNEQPRASMDHDDQATLVNVSQMITSDSINHDDNDDDATENLVSQANDDLVQEPSVSVKDTPKQSDRLQDQDQSGATEPPAESSSAATEARRSKPSKEELKAEKARKELEAKLEKEAKKQAKEDEKLKKKQAKEDKLKADLDKKMAKKQEKEEAKREKREAKESKKLQKLAKKDEKKAAKKSANQDKGDVKPAGEEDLVAGASTSATTVVPAPAQEASADVVVEEPITTRGSKILSETPINTETEVERIVEEVVGEDGILTKTTKLIETKYVTTRREELETSERREVPVELYEKMNLSDLTNSNQEEASRRLSLSSSSSFASSGRNHHEGELEPPVTTQVKQRPIQVVPAYEHKELDEICATPSFFGPDLPEGMSSGSSPKKAMKKRMKLNKKLIKRALKLAKSESKRAKKSAREAESEIAVCDEAAKQACKKLKRAVKEAKKARRIAEKAHKKMDKVDKKLAEREKKIQKKQRKLDKRAAKLAKSEAKRRMELEAKKLRRPLGGSKKSIRLEDIGDPVLKSSSRLSIGETLPASSIQLQAAEQHHQRTVIERDSPASEELQVVEMSLEDNERQHAARLPAASGANAAADDNEPALDRATTTSVEANEQTSQHQVSVGQEARKLHQVDEEDNQSEEIDVVNDLPDIQSAHAQSQRKLEATVVDQQ